MTPPFPPLPLPDPVPLPDPAAWSRRPPLAWKAACAAVRFLPKGGGVAANWIGRKFLRGARFAVQMPTGCILAIEPGNLAYFALLAERKAHGQVETVKRCLAHINAETVFFDIGANAGYVSAEAARRAQFVAAFEPQPALAAAAAASAALNRLENMRVFQAALGREAGVMDLFIPRFGIHASAIAREAGAKAIQCPRLVLDELVRSGALPPPGFMKIDVEGAELEVFAGAAETLRAHRPTLLFEADENLERFGVTRQNLLDFLASLAPYHFFAAAGGEFIPITDPEAGKATDILAKV